MTLNTQKEHVILDKVPMESQTTELTSKEEVLAAWDGESVIVREHEGYVYVYPLLGKGYSYPEIDLKQECNLMSFSDADQAMLWAQSRGYFAVQLG